MPFTRLTLMAMSLAVFAQAAPVVDYDIVYVRQPRAGDNEQILWPEVFHPAGIEPGCDLMLLHPDGTEEILPSKFTRRLHPGDRLRVETPGGGGWGA